MSVEMWTLRQENTKNERNRFRIEFRPYLSKQFFDLGLKNNLVAKF